ncbi:MAG TPA: hypothetical protein VK815_00675 [Candidatus Acidoferrales bacterium]|jgi:hypothetical protein|nr:hypothetical protein [Candidatus Acidoferrales bacterium]
MTLTELLESIRRVELRTNRLVKDAAIGMFSPIGESVADFCSLTLNDQHVSNGCSLSRRERVRVRGNAASNLPVCVSNNISARKSYIVNRKYSHK